MNAQTLDLATLTNGQAIQLEAIPQFATAEFERTILGGVAEGRRVAALFGVAAGSS